MRLRAAMVVVAAALAVAGCTSAPLAGPSTASVSPTTPEATSSTAPTSPPSSAVARAARLSAQSDGEAQVIVAVPGGHEAATFDQAGSIRFWTNPSASTTWRQTGHSTYPYEAEVGAPPHATVRGALLRAMTHATFIVHGTFTTDGGGNAVAFTTGEQGWGAVKAEANGNIYPSGQPVGADRIGLTYGLDFVDGLLQTKDCPTDRSIAECAGHLVDKTWVWTGTDFRRS